MRQFVSKVVLTGLVASSMGSFVSAAHAQSLPPTNVTVKNSRTTTVTLTSKNVTGTLTPTPATNILAGATDSYASVSSGTSDAGVVYYSGCRFNWSKILSGSSYTFSIGATPTGTCTAVSNSQNASTGAYALTFTTK